MMQRIALTTVLLVLIGLSVASTAAVAQETTTLSISVTNSDGDPVGGVELTASWQGGSTTATTVSNGQALMDVPSDQEVEIKAEHEDYVRNWHHVVTTSESVDLTVYPKATAQIQVEDEDSRVEDAFVVVRKDGRIATTGSTDANGLFNTGVIEEGEYRVTVSKSGYYTTPIEFEAVGDVAQTVSIEQGSATVSFSVEDDHFDSPQAVSGATIRVDGVGTIQTQDNGQAAMNLPVNTDFDVTVEKNGYDDSTAEISVDEEPLAMDFTLRRTPEITAETVSQRVVVGEQSRVEVTNSYDEPVAGASVYLDGEEVGQTDDRGVLMVPIETTGEHEIRASYEDLDSERITVEAFSTQAEVESGTEDEPTEESAGIIGMIRQLLGGLLDFLG